jgi:flagellar basal-body rod protein FlgG
MSNVDAITEMVNMIAAQRAYELNSKCITVSDSMLQTASGIVR